MNKLVWLALMLLSGPAMAGSVYRCVGADGIPNYSSKRETNAVCKVVANSGPTRLSTYSTPPVPAPVATPASAGGLSTGPATASAPAAKQVVFQSNPGNAAPVAAAGASRVLRGTVYRYEKDGITHYTNVRPRGIASAKALFTYVESCFACGALPGVDFGRIALNTSAYSSEIHSAAQQYGVEPL